MGAVFIHTVFSVLILHAQQGQLLLGTSLVHPSSNQLTKTGALTQAGPAVGSNLRSQYGVPISGFSVSRNLLRNITDGPKMQNTPNAVTDGSGFLCVADPTGTYDFGRVVHGNSNLYGLQIFDGKIPSPPTADTIDRRNYLITLITAGSVGTSPGYPCLKYG